MFAEIRLVRILFDYFKAVIMKAICLIILCFIIAFSVMEAQDMNVIEKDGSQTSFKINDIAKMHFNSDDIIIEGKSGIISTYQLSDIQLISFKEYVSVPNSALNKNNIQVIYPNPAENSLIVQHISSDILQTNVEIINSKGEVILEREFLSGAGIGEITLDISSIPAGVYICRIIEGKAVSSKLFVKY